MNATELFFQTIQSGKTENLKLQLDRNPSLVNIKDLRGFTPLIFASYFGNIDATKVLIDSDADIDGTDASGNTALIGVSFKGGLKLAEVLINHGASINTTNNQGTSALSFATQYNQIAMVRLLLDKGADKGIVDNNGKQLWIMLKKRDLLKSLLY